MTQLSADAPGADGLDEAAAVVARLRARAEALDAGTLDVDALDDIAADLRTLREMAGASARRREEALAPVRSDQRPRQVARPVAAPGAEAAVAARPDAIEGTRGVENEIAGETTAAIIIATGRRDRMNSDIPKMLHRIAGRSLIAHTLSTLAGLKLDRTVVVVNAGMESIAPVVAPAELAVLDSPGGTGRSVMAAREALEGFTGDVLILFGDAPLMRPETLEAALKARHTWPRPTVVVLGFRPDDTAQFGRLVMVGEVLHAVVTYGHATPEVRAIGLCNAGVMVVDGALLFSLLDTVVEDEDNLFDIVSAVNARSLKCRMVEADARELFPVNSREDLAKAEIILQHQLRRAAMESGVSLIDPETIYLCHDTVIGRDSTVGPNVVFGPGVTVGAGATIKAFSHLEGVEIADGAVVGPLERVEPDRDDRRYPPPEQVGGGKA